jgi:mannose-6-phosphate isomerase
VSSPIVKLRNPIQAYAWGSRVAIAALQGRDGPTAEPEAELWIGDHPKAPSRVVSPEGELDLPRWIARDPEGVLGPGRDCLPFLAKVLAAERALSLQVHPNAEQARRGFAREERSRTPPEERCYSDANEKHEVLIALSRFEALCGFRSDDEVEPLLDSFPSLAPVRDAGARLPLSVRLFRHLQSLAAGERRRLAGEIAAFARGPGTEARFACRLAAEHPGDPLALAPVLLNPVILDPGRALVVRPGTLHTYLSGTGVEVMTRSDNVIRGGLTRKHVDTGELAAIALAEAGPAETLAAEPCGPGARRYRTGSGAFGIEVLELGAGVVRERAAGRATVLLCAAGDLRVLGGGGDLPLRSGEALLVPASVEAYRLRGSAGRSEVFEVASG